MESPKCQTLNFARPFFPNSFVLLEVEKSVADAFSSSDSLSLTIRGHCSDPLVVCTSSRTFGAKDVEVSNTLLLLDGTPNGAGANQQHIVSITNRFVELSEAFLPDQTFRLKALLEQNLLDFYNENAPAAEESKGIKLSELLDQVQISEQQLREELAKFAVVEPAEGIFHLLNDGCQQKFLDELVELFDDADTIGLQISAFSADSLRQKVSPHVTDIGWFLRLFCTQNDDGSFCVCPSTFVRCRAQFVLRAAADRAKQWRLDEFEQSVRRLLPDAFRHLNPCDFLHGIALLSDSLVYGKTLRALLPETLPRELGPRLTHLFSLKASWKRDELRPYVADFCSNSAKMEELLLKYCKVIGTGAERAYIYRQM
ncbi:hypothetical protein niasHT_021474 [Heterodera trifolii]|uniref:Sister chromatid cohesion protein DCC1 n=1 Tax=Heterodera trifolii TaxID=157864 RepID=A0ABD2JW70_9BILA